MMTINFEVRKGVNYETKAPYSTSVVVLFEETEKESAK